MGCQLGDATTRREAPRGGQARRAAGAFFPSPRRNPKKPALEVTTEAGRGGAASPRTSARRARRPGHRQDPTRARSRGRAVERSSGRASAAPRGAETIDRTVPPLRTATYPVQHAPPPTVLGVRPRALATLPASAPRAPAVRADERLASPRRSSRRASSNSAARGRSRRRNRERSASACFSSRALFPRRAPSGGGDFAVTSERRSPSSLSARRMIETASARSEQSALSFHRANEGPLDRTRVESRRSNHQSTFGYYFEYYCRGYSATPL